MAKTARSNGRRRPAKADSALALIPAERVERSILILRGQRVILDFDLAALFGVTTKRLNEQVRRNRDRFPPDFMFQLSEEEFANLRSQFATSSWGGRRIPPFAFTEHGAIMAANVLNSARAVHASVMVVRAFVRLREMLTAHGDLARKLEELEKRYDGQFEQVFAALRALMKPLEAPRKKRIGFNEPT